MNVGGYNFSSAMAIAAWAESREADETNQMQQLMNNSDAEEKRSEELTKLQGEIKDAVTVHQYGKVAQDIENFLAEHKGDSDYEALQQTLQPIADRLNQAQAIHDGKKMFFPTGTSQSDMQAAETKAAEQLITSDVVSGWNDQIQSYVDAAGQDSKFVMLQIQDLQSQANQAMDAASALIKNGNDTLNTIIRNF